MMERFSLKFLIYTSITLVSYINWHCHAAVTISDAITSRVDEAREDGEKIFAIQNANDNTYLKSNIYKRDCELPGDVFTSRYEDQHSTAYRWIPKGVYGGVALDVESRDFRKNEVTYRNKPACYREFAEYELVEAYAGTLRIKNLHSKKCLTGNGIGKRISFEECQNIWSQLWYLIDLDNEKLYEEERK